MALPLQQQWRHDAARPQPAQRTAIATAAKLPRKTRRAA